LPSDATYTGKHQTFYSSNNGGPEAEQYVYDSPNLANEFPASMFTDEKGNQGKPALIGLTMSYDLSDTTRFVDCGVQVGLQSN
jgi:hypothetical protein